MKTVNAFVFIATTFTSAKISTTRFGVMVIPISIGFDCVLILNKKVLCERNIIRKKMFENFFWEHNKILPLL